MAINIRSPWWVSALLAFGLLLIFTGERAAVHTDSLRTILTGLGLAAILVATAIRFYAFTRTEGRQRKVELIALLCHIGVLVALAGYALTTSRGLAMLGISESSAIERATTAITVLWVIMLCVAVVPLFMIETSQGIANRSKLRDRDGVGDVSVDLFRAKEMATAGLTIALATAFLMVTCNIADQRNIRKDVSYFKTSSPGESTIKIAKSFSQPVTVYLFFPDVNEVAEEVEAYFQSLAQHTDMLTVERHNPVVEFDLAKKFSAGSATGTVVLVKNAGDKSNGSEPSDKSDDSEPSDKGDDSEPSDKGDDPAKQGETGKKEDKQDAPQYESTTLATDIDKAKKELRAFDGKIQGLLMEVIREQRTAYFSVGHGELNKPKEGTAATRYLKESLRQAGYKTRDWAGLGRPVPEDASILFVMAPAEPLLPEDLEAIGAYLDGGGSLFLVLDPDGKGDLGGLEKHLGYRFNPAFVTDEDSFFSRSRIQGSQSSADRRNIVTTKYSTHATMSTMSRMSAAGFFFLGSGSFEEADFAPAYAKRKQTVLVRSMPSAFLDLDNDLSFTAGSETKQHSNLIVAVEEPEPTTPQTLGTDVTGGEAAKPAKVEKTMRAVLVADGGLFDDICVSSARGTQCGYFGQPLAEDSIKWLGGEEEFIGETETEADKPIEHTQNQDKLWFYLTVVAAPVLVFGFGMLLVLVRRKLTTRSKS